MDNSFQCIKKLLDKLTATSVHTFDFSTLYTNLPLKSIEDALQQLVIKMFRTSGRNYILVNTFYKNAFWSDSSKNGYKVFTLDKAILCIGSFSIYMCGLVKHPSDKKKVSLWVVIVVLL